MSLFPMLPLVEYSRQHGDPALNGKGHSQIKYKGQDIVLVPTGPQVMRLAHGFKAKVTTELDTNKDTQLEANQLANKLVDCAGTFLGALTGTSVPQVASKCGGGAESKQSKAAVAPKNELDEVDAECLDASSVCGGGDAGVARAGAANGPSSGREICSNSFNCDLLPRRADTIPERERETASHKGPPSPQCGRCSYLDIHKTT